MRVLVVGGSGLLGKKLLDKLSYNHEVGGTYNTRPHENCKYLDITSKRAVEQFIELYQPEVTIHAAALKNADFCEENRELAWKVNVEGTKNLVETCKKYQIKLIYISSDYVFDGACGPYDEQSKPKPINFYGLTKLEGERIVKEELIDYIIIRPAILYGYNDGTDETFITLIRERARKGLVEVDNYIKKYPVLIDDIATLIERLLEKDESGVFHIGSGEGVTKYEWALKIADIFGLERIKIRPIKRLQKAPRPRDVQFKSSKTESLGIRVIGIKEGLKKIKMQEYCTFKLLYAKKPHESMFGVNVASLRMDLGGLLAEESEVEGDIVVPIPETGMFYALGYSEKAGIPLRFGVVRKSFAKKTLYEPKYEKRTHAIEKKLIVIPKIVKDRKIVLIDEAVLSGATLRTVVEKLRQGGSGEIHVRIPSPPVLHKCPIGEYPPSLRLLLPRLGSTGDVTREDIEEKLKKYLGVNSFKFMTLKTFNENVSRRSPFKCLNCFIKE